MSLSKGMGNWFRLAVEFLLGSGIGQFIGLLSGLLYARFMPLEEYALYALVLTTMNFTNITSDMGLTGSITYFWRQAREHNIDFISFLKEIRQLRTWLLAISIAISAVVLTTIGTLHDYQFFDMGMSFAMLAATVWLGIDVSIELQVLRLRGDFRKTYSVQLVGQCMRLLFAVALAIGLWRNATFALAGGAAGALVTWFVIYRNSSTGKRDTTEYMPHVSLRNELLSYVLPVAPTVLLFALQDTVIFWIAALYGPKEVLAEVFALGRILAIIAVASAFTMTVAVPRIASIDDQRRFSKAGIILTVGLAALGFAIVMTCWAAPSWILALLGSQYVHLHYELVIVATTGAVTLINTAVVLLNRAKGWVRLDPVCVVVQTAALVVICLLVNFSTTSGVLLASTLATTISLVVNIITALLGTFLPSAVRVSFQPSE